MANKKGLFSLVNGQYTEEATELRDNIKKVLAPLIQECLDRGCELLSFKSESFLDR